MSPLPDYELLEGKDCVFNVVVTSTGPGTLLVFSKCLLNHRANCRRGCYAVWLLVRHLVALMLKLLPLLGWKGLQQLGDI